MQLASSHNFKHISEKGTDATYFMDTQILGGMRQLRMTPGERKCDKSSNFKLPGAPPPTSQPGNMPADINNLEWPWATFMDASFLRLGKHRTTHLAHVLVFGCQNAHNVLIDTQIANRNHRVANRTQRIANTKKKKRERSWKKPRCREVRFQSTQKSVKESVHKFSKRAYDTGYGGFKNPTKFFHLPIFKNK